MLCLTCCIYLGCGNDQILRYHVSGTVTFNGQPVPGGLVLLNPDVAAGNRGIQGIAEIHDGAFDTAARGKGITGGKYELKIRGFTADAAPRVLFSEYTVKIDLPQEDSHQSIEIPPEAALPASAEFDPV